MAAIDLLNAEEVRRIIREELERFRAANGPAYWSVKEAAEKTGLSEATLRRRIKAGELPSKRVGSRVLIPSDALGPEQDDAVVELAHAARFRR
jgi:excisionase family DNA binding protein